MALSTQKFWPIEGGPYESGGPDQTLSLLNTEPQILIATQYTNVNFLVPSFAFISYHLHGGWSRSCTTLLFKLVAGQHYGDPKCDITISKAQAILLFQG